MGHRFYEAAFTDAVLAAQAEQGSARAYAGFDQGPVYNGEFCDAEAEFIAARDSFYLATIGAGGWPYVQHRGGPIGFVEVIDPQTLVFPDYRGNRQYISLGNISENPRVCIFMMDYERQARLKILGTASLIDAPQRPPLGEAPFNLKRTERHWMIKLEGFDWNCQQYIPRRFSEDRVREVVGSLQEQIRVLENKMSTPERSQ
jgi:predicted pyridoxine 5'-phosphate oxidase superfamily flavin-nucleotide-binding protein